jgi:integrase
LKTVAYRASFSFDNEFLSHNMPVSGGPNQTPKAKTDAMPYLQSKHMGRRGHVKKTDVERVVTEAQWRRLLEVCEQSKEDFNANWKRDYTALYLGYMLGLRIGEAVLLERNHFSDLEKLDVVRLPTLKQSERIQYVCRSCKRKCRVKSDRMGTAFTCSCGTEGTVPKLAGFKPHIGAVEMDLPFVEEQTVGYLIDYIQNHMRPDQRWFFESPKNPKCHISTSHMSRIFNTYAEAAGLSKKYSWHSLRHGRGVRVWSLFKDLVMVKGALRHRNIAAAQIYAGLDPETKADYKKKMERVAFDPLASKKRKAGGE